MVVAEQEKGTGCSAELALLDEVGMVDNILVHKSLGIR